MPAFFLMYLISAIHEMLHLVPQDLSNRLRISKRYHLFLILGLEFQYHFGHNNFTTLPIIFSSNFCAFFIFHVFCIHSSFPSCPPPLIQDFVKPYWNPSLAYFLVSLFLLFLPFNHTIKYHQLIFYKTKL